MKHCTNHLIQVRQFVVSVAPDYAENVKFADNWLAPNPGTDAAVAQAMTHCHLHLT
jgi:nitrate reductase alpha subunit